eukprot:TRINITY_DN246_c0_g1_i8.p1 TRINITY_DN246_c0_g1~~TRINITY_DN246_c0_g1_i8.p1  ORF type:complete len:259 (-),score=53.70 TRINITY_DN246_c0_g1_i8:285-1061(-)
MECFDTESGDNIMSVGLFVQGPPVITLNDGSVDTFSLLPPDINRADIEILTQNATLSTNLVGRWYKPDNTSTSDASLDFPLFHQSDEGLYRFYVSNWTGQQQLAIQINISLIDSSFGQLINSTTYISLTEDSILITNTTLYCVSANSKSPDIFWSYVDPSGTKTYLTAITNNNSTGISTLHVYSNRPGEYSCLVTTDDGSMKTHSVKMLDVTLYTEPKNGDNYTYTSGIDAEDTFLFCNTEDSSVQLYNIYWRRCTVI